MFRNVYILPDGSQYVSPFAFDTREGAASGAQSAQPLIRIGLLHVTELREPTITALVMAI